MIVPRARRDGDLDHGRGTGDGEKDTAYTWEIKFTGLGTVLLGWWVKRGKRSEMTPIWVGVQDDVQIRTLHG